MHQGAVEERASGQTELGDRVPVVEAFDIRPVLFGGGGAVGQCAFQLHLALEGVRKDGMDAGLVAADNSAIWQADASRRHFRTCDWRISEYGMEVEQVRPLSRVLGACDLPVRAIHDRVGTV